MKRTRTTNTKRAFATLLALASLTGCAQVAHDGRHEHEIGQAQAPLLLTAAPGVPSPTGMAVGYGYSMASEGELRAVSMPHFRSNQGVIRVFRSATDSTGYSLTPYCNQPNCQLVSYRGFGCAVAVKDYGAPWVVAAEGCNDPAFPSGNRTARLYTWGWNASTSAWQQTAPLDLSSEAPVVDIALVSDNFELFALTQGGNRVHRFVWAWGSWEDGGSWQLSSTATSIAGPRSAPSPILVGEPSLNRVSTFDTSGRGLGMISAPSGMTQFGRDVAYDGKTAVIGAANAAATVAIPFASSIGTAVALPAPRDLESSDDFGRTVAVVDARGGVGAPGWDSGTGRAFSYAKRGANWLRQHELQSSQPSTNLQFGRALAIVGESVHVGAPANGAAKAPTSYFFDLPWDSANLRGFDMSQDGAVDLVIGNPGMTVNALATAGAASLFMVQPFASGWTGGESAGDITPLANARFGQSLAWGDFDGDSYDDVVIGAPFARVGGKANAGSFTLYTAAQIFAGTGMKTHARGGTAPIIVGTPGANDKLASAMVAGDFNSDGYDDLAVGAPGDTYMVGGSVQVFYGSASNFTQNQTLLSLPSAVALDAFGSALTVGDFNCDGYDDLAVGAPGRASKAGEVHVFRGGSSGLPAAAQQVLVQTGFTGESSEAGDQFGFALSALNIDRDKANGYNCDDLAIGAPYEDVGTVVDAGTVGIMKGKSGSSGMTRWYNVNQDKGDIGDLTDSSATGDNFGKALTFVHTTSDAYDDLVIGAPGKTINGAKRGGAFWVLRGYSTGLRGDTVGSQVVRQNFVHSTAVANAELGASFGSAGAQSLIVGLPNYTSGTFTNAGEAVAFTFDPGTGGILAGTVIDQTQMAAPFNVQGKWFGTSITAARPAR